MGSEGEELLIAYTDLYALREDRRSALLRAKLFECECSRCSCATADESISRWLFLDKIEWVRESEIRKWNHQIQSARELLQQSKILKCLEMLRDVLKEAMTQLHPHHVLLYHARDLVIEILKANPDEAAYPTELADYAEACAKACEAELSPFHIIKPETW